MESFTPWPRPAQLELLWPVKNVPFLRAQSPAQESCLQVLAGVVAAMVAGIVTASDPKNIQTPLVGTGDILQPPC